ncbi:MAG: hypothetical protein AAFR81_28195 [Chloroflexota bacterium]
MAKNKGILIAIAFGIPALMGAVLALGTLDIFQRFQTPFGGEYCDTDSILYDAILENGDVWITQFPASYDDVSSDDDLAQRIEVDTMSFDMYMRYDLTTTDKQALWIQTERGFGTPTLGQRGLMLLIGEPYQNDSYYSYRLVHLTSDVYCYEEKS